MGQKCVFFCGLPRDALWTTYPQVLRSSVSINQTQTKHIGQPNVMPKYGFIIPSNGNVAKPVNSRHFTKSGFRVILLNKQCANPSHWNAILTRFKLRVNCSSATIIRRVWADSGHWKFIIEIIATDKMGHTACLSISLRRRFQSKRSFASGKYRRIRN